jgi:hypothetical protein
VFEAFVSRAATERHTLGTSHPDRYNPDTWTDEYTHLSKPGQREIQAALLYDYRTNVASYPEWQAWLRERQPPTLVVWGRNDPSFIAPGAEAFRRDLPNAEIHLLDASHFALDEKNDEIARLILAFLAQTRELTNQYPGQASRPRPAHRLASVPATMALLSSAVPARRLFDAIFGSPPATWTCEK